MLIRKLPASSKICLKIMLVDPIIIGQQFIDIRTLLQQCPVRWRANYNKLMFREIIPQLTDGYGFYNRIT